MSLSVICILYRDYFKCPLKIYRIRMIYFHKNFEASLAAFLKFWIFLIPSAPASPTPAKWQEVSTFHLMRKHNGKRIRLRKGKPGKLWVLSLNQDVVFTRPTNRPGQYWSLFSHRFPYVRPSHFSKYLKQKKRRVKIMITTGGTMGLAEGIIDDTCLVYTESRKETFLAKSYYKTQEKLVQEFHS